MKKFYLTLFASLLAINLIAQSSNDFKLSFNPNGEFKIVQFTDMHLGHDMGKNDIVSKMIKEVVESEKPDLVIFTGDNTTMDELPQAWEVIGYELAARKIPWTAVLGNHDDEFAIKREEIIRIISSQPYCVMKNCAEGIDGHGNHILSIYGSKENEKVLSLIYCLDSRSYSTLKSVKGYGWVELSQINWYRQESAKFTQNNGGTPLPALLFQHIPLPEHFTAWSSKETPTFGERNEDECSPKINTGLFAQLLLSGDVMGVFVGHDHVNDYSALLYNIVLGYGRASGGRNTYGDKTPGGRVIILKEGKRTFDSYLRELSSPNKIFPYTYPESFGGGKK